MTYPTLFSAPSTLLSKCELGLYRVSLAQSIEEEIKSLSMPGHCLPRTPSRA